MLTHLGRAPREVYRVYGEHEFFASVEAAQPVQDNRRPGTTAVGPVVTSGVQRGAAAAVLVASVAAAVGILVTAGGFASASRKERARLLARKSGSLAAPLARGKLGRALGQGAGNRLLRAGRASGVPAGDRQTPGRGHGRVLRLDSRSRLASLQSSAAPRRNPAPDASTAVVISAPATGPVQAASGGRYPAAGEPSSAQSSGHPVTRSAPAAAPGPHAEFGFER